MSVLRFSESTKAPRQSWFERFVPRSSAKTVFVLAMLCYSWTLETVTTRLIRLLGFWPETAYVRRAVRLDGFDARTIAVGRLALVTLILAPVLESFIVIAVVELLRRLKFNSAAQIIGSALLICLLHGIQYPVRGFVVAPAFLIGAATYIYWRRVSFWAGTQMIILLHSFGNSIVFLGDLAERLHR
jgi:hypothetical protein